MPTPRKKVSDYFETSDPKEPDEKLLKKMTLAQLIEVIRIMAERWKSDTEQNMN